MRRCFMSQNPFLDTVINYEKVIKEIFVFYGFNIEINQRLQNYRYDFEVQKNNKNYLVETKYFRTLKSNPQLLLRVTNQLFEHGNKNFTYILVVNSIINDDLKSKLCKNRNLLVIDIQNLLFLVHNNPDLKSQLLSLLDFSVVDIIPKEPDNKIIFPQNSISEHLPSKEASLKTSIINWSTSYGNYAYENLCTEILNYLFDNELTLWHTQEKSNDNLYRFDLICKIKDGNISGFWTTLIQFFNSKYIIFEFKNYNEQITQREIYTTDKYLYKKALRSVAIIISCKGASLNAEKAIRGTLRENGKLILSISNEDMIKMMDMKLNNELPSDYLYSKFDELMIDLEK